MKTINGATHHFLKKIHGGLNFFIHIYQQYMNDVQ
jgi:hypothetical protein